MLVVLMRESPEEMHWERRRIMFESSGAKASMQDSAIIPRKAMAVYLYKNTDTSRKCWS